MAKRRPQNEQIRPKAVDPAVKRRKATRHSKFSRDDQKKRESGTHLRIAVPVPAQKKSFEFLLADIVITDESDTPASERTVVDVLATKVAVSSDLAMLLVKDLLKAGAKIDTKRLTELVHRVILDGAMMSPAEAEIEFLERFGFGFSDIVKSTSGQHSDGPAQDTGREWSLFGAGLAAGGTLLAKAAAVGGTGAAVGTTAAGANVLLVASTLVAAAPWVVTAGVVVYFGAKWLDAEYPDTEHRNSEASARLLLLLAAQFGESVLSNVRRAIDAGHGSHFGAPEDGTTRQLFGVTKFDAYILALVRTAIEAATGGHETDPSPLSEGGGFRYVDPDLLAVDPGWNPYAVNAMIESALDRAGVIDTLTDRIQVSTGG